MVVKGTNNGNKRKLEELPSSSSSSCAPTGSNNNTASTNPTTTTSLPQSSPKTNNIIPPSTGSPPILNKHNTIPRPRAQRKFAQGVVIPSPPVTPYKVTKPVTPVKRVPLPQYSPPTKRPKTEDFLTFLCYRGTSALPKSLNFFNYPSHYDRVTDYVKVKSRNELKSWRKSPHVNPTTTKTTSQPFLPPQSCSSTQRSQGAGVSTTDPKVKETLPKSTSSSSQCKQSTNSKRKNTEAINKKADKEKKSTPQLVVPKPKQPTHINEQDAKFAISALKLKYQERRLANGKPTLSVATKIAKKVKDRRVILTRSKSKDDDVILTKNPKRLKTAIEATLELNRRNAPSPDIIDGVKIKSQGGQKESSSSDDSESSSSSESEKSSKTSKEEETTTEKGIRSLRSGGKSVILFTRKSTNVNQKVTLPKRVSTRASRRTTSPLRELPMYGVSKKRKKNKTNKDKNSSRAKKSDKKESDEKTSPDRGNSRRPSRKTKESAAFFLNLITKSFSSDEQEIGDKTEEDSEGDDTSSSETKFLENRYKAIMKRDGDKGGKSKDNGNKKSSAKGTKKAPPVKMKKKPPPDQSKSTKKTRPEKRILRSQSSREDKEHKVSTDRVTRHRRVTIPSSPTPKPVHQNHAGAARKSASVYPRKSKNSSSSSSPSSSENNNSSNSSSSSDSEDSTGDRKSHEMSPEPQKGKRGTLPGRPTRKKQQRRSTKSSDEEEGSESEGESGKRSATGSGTGRRSFSTGVTSENLEPLDDQQRAKSDTSTSVTTSEDSDSNSSDDDSSEEEEEERMVEKVEIAIQVDMDLEESLELEAAGGYPSDDPPPPVLTPQISFMSQGCQSDQPPRSEPMTSHVPPRSHHHQHPINAQQHHQSQPQMSIPPPPLLPFPGPSFYPTLNNIEFISQQRTQHDFSVMLPTIGLGPTVSTYSFGPSTVLTHNQLPSIPIGYTSASISAATTLQTHITQHNIRSVAANLDIPLVRPIVPPNLHTMSLTRPQVQDPHHRPLTRPIMNLWPETSRAGHHQIQQPHYSAFRVPTTVIGGPPPQQQRMMSHVSAETVRHHQFLNLGEPGPRFQQQQMNTSRGGQMGGQVPTHHPGLSAHGLSLIKSLPNVSIVPKFDRTAKTILIHQDQQPTSSTSGMIPSKPTSKGKKEGPPKERGRKRKDLPFTKALSPLLVRKDSSNPITYAGTASKKNLKGKEPEVTRESVPQSPPPFPPTTTTTQFNQLISEQNLDMPGLDHKNGRGNSTTRTDSMDSSTVVNKRPNSKSSGNEAERMKKSKIPVDSSTQSKPEVPLEKSKERKNDPEKCKSRKPETVEKNPKRNRKNSNASEGDKERGRSKKGGTESPRPASVTSDRPKSSETPDEVKLEDICPYYPTEEEFQDPLKYIQQIQKEAEKFGIARIVPPKSFRPECNVEDDMRFTAYNHYIHRMNNRWGPNVHVRVGIMENLRKSKVGVTASNPPMIGGMEVDLTTLYHTVQSFGGLTEVIQKDKWNKVSDAMHIPKAANDRKGKLDAIYVKYVLPYEMLSENERRKLLNKVEKKWKVHLSKNPESESEGGTDEDDPLLEAEDCITKGKSTPLSSYYRVARNTMTMIFKNKEPSTWSEVEAAYWKLVRERDRHLCVYSGSIDCAGLGWGFPLPKGGTKHPWNLKVLANNPGSILRSMGSVMGATVPTLHVGMVFTTYCWYRDPHNLPWVEYLHSGGNKIWYVIPASHELNFRQVLKEQMPRQCKDKKIWLTSDSAMVPPELLLSQGIPLYRTVQNPGEFLVVFPKAFTSAICTGYVISESVCYAPPDWLQGALQTFQDIRDSREPPVFPLEKLLLSILTDTRASLEILKMALPVAERVVADELKLRKQLKDLGIGSGKMTPGNDKGKKIRKKEDVEIQECETCNYVLHLSMVMHKSKKVIYCLPHGIQHLTKNKSKIKASILLLDHTDDQLRSILGAAQSRLK